MTSQHRGEAEFYEEDTNKALKNATKNKTSELERLRIELLKNGIELYAYLCTERTFNKI